MGFRFLCFQVIVLNKLRSKLIDDFHLHLHEIYTKMSNSELAWVYAALILADDDVAITGEKLQTILKAAGVDVEPYWPGLFAKALESCNVKDLITNVGSGVGAAPAAGGAAPAAGGAAPAEEKKEEKAEEPEEESDDDMGFGLFD